jgi:hypothetical protein
MYIKYVLAMKKYYVVSMYQRKKKKKWNDKNNIFRNYSKKNQIENFLHYLKKKNVLCIKNMYSINKKNIYIYEKEYCIQ